MDRINKFIAQKPTRKTRTFQYNGKSVTIHKRDVRRLKLFKQNKCLDKRLNLYPKNVLKWSKESSAALQQTEKKTKPPTLPKKQPKHKETNKNPVIDLWENETAADQKYEIDRFLMPRKSYSGLISELRFNMSNLNAYLETFHNKYFQPAERVEVVSCILPFIPEKHEVVDYPEEIALSFDFYNKGTCFSVYNEFMAVYDGQHIQCFEIASKYVFKVIKCLEAVTGIRLYENILVYSSKNRVFVDFYKVDFNLKQPSSDSPESLQELSDKSKYETSEAVEKIQKTEALFFKEKINCGIKKTPNKKKIDAISREASIKEIFKQSKEDIVSKYIRFEQHYIVIDHNSTIKDFCFYKDNRNLVVATSKNIYCHDLIKKCTIKPFKLGSQQPLKLFCSQSELFISTTNHLMSVNLEKNRRKTPESSRSVAVYEFARNFTIPLAYPQSFSVSHNFIVVTDKLMRICIISNQRIVKVFEQDDCIKEVAVHRIYPFFVAIGSNFMNLFYGKIENDDFKSILIKKWVGNFNSAVFHEDLPWIYCINNGNVVIFT